MGRRNPDKPRHARLRIDVEFSIGRGCGKRRFATYADAELVLAMALGRSLQGERKRREQRIYRCPHCNDGYHLTSQDRNYDTHAEVPPVN